MPLADAESEGGVQSSGGFSIRFCNAVQYLESRIKSESF